MTAVYKWEVLGPKLFKLLPLHHLVRFQHFEEIENEVFQVHDPNPTAKWLKRTSFDERLLLFQSNICHGKRKMGANFHS